MALKPGWKEQQIAKSDVVEYIEFQKVSKPSTTAVELQAGLLQDGIHRDENLPSKSTIGDIVHKDLRYTLIHIRNYTWSQKNR